MYCFQAILNGYVLYEDWFDSLTDARRACIAELRDPTSEATHARVITLDGELCDEYGVARGRK